MTIAGKISIVVAFLGMSVSASVSAVAQSYPSDLVAAYKAGVAAAKCDLALDAGKSSKLSDALQRIEQRSGLSQNDLDALWAETQDKAEADSAGFCAREGKTIDAVIASSQ